VGETLCTGNSDDYRIHNPGGPRVRGRGEADEGPEGRIEGGFLFVQLAPVQCSKKSYFCLKTEGEVLWPDKERE